MLSPSLQQGQRLTQQLAPAMRQSIRMLAMNLQELRQEIVREISLNPVIDDIDHDLETPLADAEARSDAREEALDEALPEDEAAPSVNPDEDAAERRQRFFDNQVGQETLQEHLERQIVLSDIPREGRALAEMLVGGVNDDGYFTGSIPDIMMVTGETEAYVLNVLAAIQRFDPLGCGARSLRECLLAQMEKLDDSPWEDEVRQLIDSHLEDVAAGREEAILRSLGVSHDDYQKILRELRTLDPKPGRAFQGGTGGANRIVKPEVHAVRVNGRWMAMVDDRSLPDITISKKYKQMSRDPAIPMETRAYILERTAAAELLRDAIAHREETIRAVAQEIFDRQPDFFERGLKGLKPLTMLEVAEKVGVHPTTVSRTVNDKYASTPRGTVELRRFFTQGIATTDGEIVTKTTVHDALRALVDAEDKRHPLSDEAIATKLKSQGYPVARRTVAKYRGILDIPGTSERRIR